MEEKKYKVFINNGVVAKDMDIRTATVLVRALFEEYYNDCTMIISIMQEDRAVCVD